MKYKLLFIFIILLFCAFNYNGGDDKKFNKKLDDDNHHYTDVGNIGLTVTNFGTYGHGFSLWPEQPSCEYPLGSGIEHIFDGGLWIGVWHPFATGRLARWCKVVALIEYMQSKGDVWFARMEDIARHVRQCIDDGRYSPRIDKLPYYRGKISVLPVDE